MNSWMLRFLGISWVSSDFIRVPKICSVFVCLTVQAMYGTVTFCFRGGRPAGSKLTIHKGADQDLEPWSPLYRETKRIMFCGFAPFQSLLLQSTGRVSPLSREKAFGADLTPSNLRSKGGWEPRRLSRRKSSALCVAFDFVSAVGAQE